MGRPGQAVVVIVMSWLVVVFIVCYCTAKFIVKSEGTVFSVMSWLVVFIVCSYAAKFIVKSEGMVFIVMS